MRPCKSIASIVMIGGGKFTSTVTVSIFWL